MIIYRWKIKEYIYCKRMLNATMENFIEEKKGKYGLGNICRKCQHERQSCGVSRRQIKASKKAVKYSKGHVKP
ncbi:hypothetical protein [Clostridium sp. HMP27]|uniref:hypothetical protein n=1 Tax=Clostridium sp. HMP27 TaxID=1487921 RepID=UPI00052DF2DC|nr:hypothetical protein [Clostridium sp. HMP27]KGK81148.1 hypothetical protein DP68_18545 [Clostridium sp. HMP27]